MAFRGIDMRLRFGMDPEMKKPWTRGFKVNPNMGRPWGNGTLAPTWWTMTRSGTSAQPPEFIEFISAKHPMEPSTSKPPLRFRTPCFNS